METSGAVAEGGAARSVAQGGAARSVAQVRQAAALVRAAAHGVAGLGVPETVTLAGLFSEVARVAQAAALRCARAAGDDGARTCAGETSAAALLSSLSGTTVAKARAALGVADKVAGCAPLEAALSNGDVSLDQAALIAPVAGVDPEAARRLAEGAKTSSVSELRQEVARTLQRHQRDEETVRSERQVHARRYCRTWVSGGGVRVDAFLGAQDAAALLLALDREQLRLAHEARRLGVGATHEQLRADALVGLVAATTRRAGVGRPEVVVCVDAGALRRGELADGEICEIPGVGPVSVLRARALLGEALWTLVVTDGADIATVTSTTRAVPTKVQHALLVRDRSCVVPGCGATERLQIDHWNLDFTWNGPTELSNLCRLCPAHHRLKTEQGWQLRGGPGRWEWLAPKTFDELAESHARPLRRRVRGRDDPPPTPRFPGRRDPDPLRAAPRRRR